jgi:circadian clock protein KaiB
MARRLPAPSYRLRLFVAGGEPNSTRALSTLERLSRETLKGCCRLQVVDVFKDYQAAIKHKVVAVPALVVESPLPRKVIIGSLAEEEKVLEALGLKKKEKKG